MALYKFKVTDKSGKITETLIEADSQVDATRRLQHRNMIPLEFLGEGVAGASVAGFSPWFRRFDVIDFTDRLVPLLEADIPLERALGILSEGSEEDYTTRVINDLRRGLHEGRKFSELIRDRGRLFPPLYAGAVEAGEEAGALPEIMKELRRFLMDGRDLKSFIISASIYPAVVLFVSFVVIGLLLGIFIPRFAGIIQNTSTEPIWATQVLLFLADAVPHLRWIVPLVLLSVIGLVYLVRSNPSWKQGWDSLLLRTPFISRIVLYSNLVRLCRTMSILMRSGVHLLNTVSISTKILQNSVLKMSLAGMEAELRQGQKISNALGNSRYIPQMMLKMLGVGEETGSVDTMLQRVADRYEEDLQRNLKRLISLFEPAIIVLLGCFVGFIVVVMILAIMNMQGTA